MLRIHTLGLLIALVPSLALAQSPPPPDEVQELRERVDKLERELARMRRLLDVPSPSKLQVVDPFTLVPARPAPAAQPQDGDVNIEPAGVSALTWLDRHQDADGSWPTPEHGCDISATSLAVLAFVGGGQTHRFGAHRRAVGKALKWLKRRVGIGRSGDVTAPGQRLPTLDQALATMALSEAYAVSRDFTLKRYAENASLALLVRQGDEGGWSYGGPASASNTFATAYAVLSLKAAKTAGLDTPAAAFAAAGRFFQSATAKDGRVGLYRAGDGASITLGDAKTAPAAPLLTAGSVIARIFCGEPRSVPALQAGAGQLTLLRSGFEPAYGYFATYAQLQMGGAQWTAWAQAMKRALLAGQVVDPDQAGSWDPSGIWGALGGRAATTAVNRMTLELHYRYERAKER
jgi:hypothetical protein